jgi:hypothetical protein
MAQEDTDYHGVQGYWQCARDTACPLPELEAPLSSDVLLTAVTVDIPAFWDVLLCNLATKQVAWGLQGPNVV